jgi:hypothetical protein
VKELQVTQLELKMVGIISMKNKIQIINVFKNYTFKVMAASSLANIVKSSLGPLGLDKMLVDDIGVSNLLKKGAKTIHKILIFD